MKLSKSQLMQIIKEELSTSVPVAISIPEVSPGATIQDEELDQEIEISLTDNSGEAHLETITLRQLVRAARGS